MKTLQSIRLFFHNFFGIDYRSLVVLRVGVALSILIDLWYRSKDFTAHYTDDGVLPVFEISSWASSIFPPTIHLWNGSWYFQAFLFFTAAILGVLMLVGYKTRIVTFLSWIFLISLQARNPLIRDGGDMLLKMVIFWGIFLPWGEYFSIDNALTKVKEKSSAVFSSVASMGLLLQISFVYIFTAILKHGIEWWGEWTAIEFALRIDQFTTPVGYFLLQFPIALQWLTAFVYILEFGTIFLLFFPLFTPYLRLLAIFLISGMHVGIGLSMRLGVFPFVDIVAMMAFLPTLFWEWFWKKLKTPKRTNLTIYYDGHCGFCYKMVRIMQSFFLFPEVQARPAQNSSAINRLMIQNNSWVVVDHKNENHIRYDGFLAVMSASPLLNPFRFVFALRPVRYAGELLYGFIAGHRKSVCIPVKPERKWPFLQSRLVRWVASAIGLVLITYTLLWNVMTVNNNQSTVPREIRFIGKAFSLDQFWGMFAPFPLRDDGWFIISGKLANGQEVSLFQNWGGEVSEKKPSSVSKTYSSQRTRKYFLNLWQATHAVERPRYVRFLCKKWNQDDTPEEKRLVSVKIIFMREFTLSDRSEAPVVPVTLLEKKC